MWWNCLVSHSPYYMYYDLWPWSVHMLGMCHVVPSIILKLQSRFPSLLYQLCFHYCLCYPVCLFLDSLTVAFVYKVRRQLFILYVIIVYTTIGVAGKFIFAKLASVCHSLTKDEVTSDISCINLVILEYIGACCYGRYIL